ncbi:MAG: type secretion protein [Pseudomonadota bacterium]|nr:type secretion protein [Pseudomonadota bacterium]
MYGELLRIKIHREQNAGQAVRRQQQVVEQQVQMVQQARQEVVQFREYRIQKEQQLFDEIKGQLVALRAIETMNQNIAALREQEALLETRILEEEKRLKEAQKALEEARQRHQATIREREKFDQFVEVQQAIENREQMMKEENELEEIASAAHQSRQEA